MAAVDILNNAAFAIVKEVLDRYDLGDLADWAWNQITDGTSDTEIIQSLREQDAYKTRFAGIGQRTEQGLPPISEEEYIAWEDQATQTMRFYGLPSGFYDEPQDFANLIGNDVSIREMESRVSLARQAASLAPPEITNILSEQYGVDQGGLTAFYLDPDRAVDLLERQYVAADIMKQEQDRSVPYEGITFEEGQALAAEGVTAEDAAGVLGGVEVGKELFGQTASGRGTHGTREDILDLLRGDAAAQRKIENVGRSRVAGHRGASTGGFAGGQEGFTGIGTAR